MDEGLGTLGTRTIVVELTPLKRHPCWKKDLIALMKSLPTISQVWIKKLTLKPSGPGLLFFFIDFKVRRISSSVTSLSRIAASWIEMVFGERRVHIKQVRQIWRSRRSLEFTEVIYSNVFRFIMASFKLTVNILHRNFFILIPSTFSLAVKKSSVPIPFLQPENSGLLLGEVFLKSQSCPKGIRSRSLEA